MSVSVENQFNLRRTARRTALNSTRPVCLSRRSPPALASSRRRRLPLRASIHPPTPNNATPRNTGGAPQKQEDVLGVPLQPLRLRLHRLLSGGEVPASGKTVRRERHPLPAGGRRLHRLVRGSQKVGGRVPTALLYSGEGGLCLGVHRLHAQVVACRCCSGLMQDRCLLAVGQHITCWVSWVPFFSEGD